MDHEGPGKSLSVGDFVLAELRANPAISFDEVKAKCEARDLKLFPIVFGRAKRVVALEVGHGPGVAEEGEVASPPIVAQPLRAVQPVPAYAGPKRGRGRPMSQEMSFALEYLASAPSAKAKEVHAAAALRGLEVSSAVVTRARVRLGVANVRAEVRGGELDRRLRARTPRSVEAFPAQAKALSAPAVQQGTTATAFDFRTIAEGLRELEAERDQLREALEAIAEVLDRLP